VLRVLLLIHAASAALLLSSCRASEGRQVDLVLNFTPNGSHSAYYLAEKRGLFRALGLKVNILPGSGSGNVVKAVGSGAQQVGVAGGDSLAAGVGKGVPVVSIAAIFQTNSDCLVSLAQTRLSAPSDLRGLKVGVKFGSSTHAMYEAMKRKFQLPDSIQEIAVGTGVEPLLTSAVDVLNAHADNEVVEIQAQGRRVNILRYDSLGLSAYGIVLLTNRRLLETEPRMVGAFSEAVLQGWKLTYENPEEAAQTTVDANPTLKYAIVLAQTRAALDYVVNETSRVKGIGWQDTAGWERTLKTLRDSSIINEDILPARLFTESPSIEYPKVR
jgi:NitT/TauT family transport system substrate-binding protein